MKNKDLSFRHVRGTPVSCRTVRVVPRSWPQERDYRRIYYGGDHGLIHHSKKLQEHRERLLKQRQEALYFCNTRREDRPAGPQAHLRVGGAVSSQPGVRGQRSSSRGGGDALLQAIMNLNKIWLFRVGGAVSSKPGVRGQRSSSRGGGDALLQAIMNLHREVDRKGVKRRTVMASRNTQNISISISGSLSPAPPKNCTQADEHRDLSGGSAHASASASKIFFSDLDEIPGLGGEPEEPTPEEHRAQAINNKAQEIEKLYKQDCETFGIVVKMLISKNPALEPMLLSVLHKNLVEIGEIYLENLSQFISEVNALVKPNQTGQTQP
ncbi:periphilin-1 isoform X1 [Onychostoma macrolepis]|uniref:periphilin-1 isoform X1 n=1 Tax=Onychostoma macrolepis TaxID=369639 RepID=UPI00272DA201|nr:periphilin-1 isoform X1 [Onychostoma macrolepis]